MRYSVGLALAATIGMFFSLPSAFAQNYSNSWLGTTSGDTAAAPTVAPRRYFQPGRRFMQRRIRSRARVITQRALLGGATVSRTLPQDIVIQSPGSLATNVPVGVPGWYFRYGLDYDSVGTAHNGIGVTGYNRPF